MLKVSGGGVPIRAPLALGRRRQAIQPAGGPPLTFRTPGSTPDATLFCRLRISLATRPGPCFLSQAGACAAPARATAAAAAAMGDVVGQVRDGGGDAGRVRGGKWRRSVPRRPYGPVGGRLGAAARHTAAAGQI